jgi:ribonuclease HI
VKKEKITMYTDGGSRNNPGPAAIGVWIETLGEKYSEYIGEKTNNEAEYEALISRNYFYESGISCLILGQLSFII